MPRGPRFSLSSASGAGRRFRWFGWEGHVTLRADTGLSIFDVRYKNKRILYELSHQDMYVSYSGYGGAGQTFYMDSFFGIGYNCRPLHRGLDCPWHAAYVASELSYGAAGPGRQEAVLCLFEDDLAAPAWRHTHAGDRHPHADGARGVDFVVRTVSSIGNYDYVFDVRFRQDASIEVKTTMAGYMSTLYFDPGGATAREAPFGTRVAERVLANLHDHLSGWKVDLDVAGTANAFATQRVRAGTYEQALRAAGARDARAPSWASQQVLKYIETTRPEVEAGLRVDGRTPTVRQEALRGGANLGRWIAVGCLVCPRFQRTPPFITHAPSHLYDKTWHFVNDRSLNAWGTPRGYAIVPGGTAPQLLPEDHPLPQGGSGLVENDALIRGPGLSKFKRAQYINVSHIHTTPFCSRRVDQVPHGCDAKKGGRAVESRVHVRAGRSVS